MVRTEEDLPKGIRRRDSGKYEALIYRAEDFGLTGRRCRDYPSRLAAREKKPLKLSPA